MQRKILEYFGTEQERTLPRRRTKTLRQRRYEERNKRNQKTIDDLPENVIYQVMSKLYPSALINFLLAYPRASSVHGVYSLWLQKKSNWNRMRKRSIKAYENLRESHVNFEALAGIYIRIKENLKVSDKGRINRLLQYKQQIATSHCNDLICRRSERLKKKEKV